MRCTSLVATLLTSLAAVPAQTAHAVGHRDVSWINPTASGSPILFTRLAYPSPTGGVDAPIIARSGGWPTIVWLHGFSMIGRDYMEIATQWASRGFVVVLQDSAGFSWIDQVADARVAFRKIAGANDEPSDFFHGAFDLGRIGIAGHSMGGGSIAHVLEVNPGYRCAFAIAPVHPGPAAASNVTTPFGVLVGAGDDITPWSTNALHYYLSVAPASGLKIWQLLDGAADHFDVVGLVDPDDPSFERAVEVSTGFFRAFLDVDAQGLEPCLGPVAPSCGIVERDHAVTEPRVWAAAKLRPGRAVRISLATEEGLCGVLAAASAGYAVPTPIGTLQLEPASAYTWIAGLADRRRRFDTTLAVPSHPGLIGASIALQAVGASTGQPLRLGAAIELVIEP